MLKNKVLLIFIVLAGINVVAFAQNNNTNSPYTRYGFGKMADNSFGMSRGMGGIGYGLRTGLQTNVMNPASYTAIDSLTFIFDIGANLQSSTLKQDGVSQNDINGGLEYISMQFPLGKRFAASVGLLPYSYVGYNFGNTNPDLGVVQSFSGEDGLNQLYGGLAFNVIKSLSLGVNASYLFGNLRHNSEQLFTDQSMSAIIEKESIELKGLNMQIGLQYNQKLSNKSNLILGLVYSPKFDLSATRRYAMYQGVTKLPGDTSKYKNSFSTPETFGAGFTYIYDRRLTVGADVTYQKWKEAKFGKDIAVFDGLNDFNDRTKIAVGAEYLPSLVDRNYFKKIRYRLGGKYEKSYVKFKGSDYNEYGVSMGLGFPIKADRSMLNFAIEYVKIEPTSKALINENYLKFSLNLTFNELWFFKTKFQ